MLLLFVDTAIIGSKNLALFVRNVDAVADVARTYWKGETASGLTAVSGVLDISNVTQLLDHYKARSTSQLIRGKSKDLQALLRYFIRATTSIFLMLLSFVKLPFIFALYLNKLLVVVLSLFML